MKFESEPTITKKYLLERNSQETYLEYYLGIPVKKGLFKSPLRVDNTPTCSFYRNKSGDIIFNDFSGHFYGNFLSVVMEMYSCTYYKALQIIANDFGYIKHKTLKKSTKPVVKSENDFKESGSANIQVEIQDFSQDELDWWEKFGVTEKILKKFKVYSCKNVFLNGNNIAYSTSKSPIYGYYRGKTEHGGELWRIYFPMRSSYRFLSNWTSIMIQGSKQLASNGDTLVITKSLKDVMCLYSLGIPAIAPNSENLFLTDNQFSKLKTKFKNLVLFYDNDLPGISNMKKIKKEYGIKCVWIPRSYGAKDISDFHKRYGREATLNLINQYGNS